MTGKDFAMFIVVQLIIYISYLYLDISGNMSSLSSILKFSSICLCYLATDSRNSSIKRIMAFTVISDFFLVFTPYYAMGIFSFIIVQLEYYKYITKKARFPLSHFTVMLAAGFIVSLFINFFIMPITFIVFLSCVYFITLINNILLCFMYRKKSREYVFLSVCLLLIMLCDIHVGVTNVFHSGLWYSFGMIAMWLFYLPSQVLIVLLYSTNTQNHRYL